MSDKVQFHTSSYIPALDGLRGLSIVMVLIAHLGYESIVPGGLGVTIFFFISGYIITNLLIDEYIKNDGISLKLFYSRRLLRLYPPLLLLILCVSIYLSITHKPFNTPELFAATFYYENYYNFIVLDGIKYFGSLWSLAVEEHYYLIFPFVFILLFKYPKVFLGVLIALIFIALGWRYYGVIHYNKDLAEWYCYLLTHTRFDSILYGCLASMILYLDKNEKFISFITNKPTFIGALLIIAACLVIRNTEFRNTLRYSLEGIALLVIVPAIVNVKSYKGINQLFSNKVIVFIGKLSYSIYLFHPFAIMICSSIKADGHKALFIVAAVALTAVFSNFSYYIIEKPLGKIRKKLRPAAIKPKSLAAFEA